MRAVQTAGGTALTGNKVVDDTGRPPAGPPAVRAGRARVLTLLAVAAVVLTADIITKLIVVAKLTGRPKIVLLGGFLKLTEQRNPGAAFSIGGPSTTIAFTAIAVGVVLFILRYSRRIRSLAWSITLGLLLGGATGNLTDRIFRSPGAFRGWVVDWIEIPHWPVFNVADSSIVCGGVLAVILALRGIHIDGTRQGTAAPAEAGQPDGADEQDQPGGDGG